MTPSQYYDDEPEEEIDIDKLRKTIHAEFISDLEMVIGIAKQLPESWQLEMILVMMRGI